MVGVDAYHSWDDIYVDNVARIYRLIYSHVGNRADTEDLTTEVFLAAYGPLRVQASQGEVRAYLRATAATVLASFWRRRLGVELTTINENTTDPAPVDPDDGQRATRELTAILAALSDRHRQILELRFLQGCTIRDTASIMGLTVSNTKVLQHRALRLAARHAQEQRP